MRSVHREILEWANGLQCWEQYALRRIMDGATLQEEDYRLLLRYLLEDAGLSDGTIDRPVLNFETDGLIESGGDSKIRLLAISDLQNINALVPDQRLEFSNQLTAIFGANGSGKSGYARVLGSAAFTRGDRDVLPNVMAPIDESLKQSVTVAVLDGGMERVISYEIGSGCPELAGFYMFDSTAVHAHMSEANAISFSPAGLASLPQLAECTDKVRELLDQEIVQRNKNKSFRSFFDGQSEISDLVEKLDTGTDLDKLKALSVLSPPEQERLNNLPNEIAELRLQDSAKIIGELEQTKADLQDLIGRLEFAEQALTDGKLEGFAEALDEVEKWRNRAKQLSTSEFDTDHTEYVGSDAWVEFIRSAQTLAQLAGDEEQPYPKTEDRCILCQQPLGPEALTLIRRLWQFLDDEVQESLAEANQAVEVIRESFQEIDLGFFEPQAVWYRYLLEQDKVLIDNIGMFLEESRKRRSETIKARKRSEVPFHVSIPSSRLADLRGIIAKIDEEISAARAKDTSKKIDHMENDLCSLQHRVVLQQYIAAISEYVEDLRWAERARKARGSTRHITRKYNELFDQLVTQRYIELFEETLVELGRPLRVGIRTRGRKGEVIKQVVVKADQSVPAKVASPEKVLSEGEKRAVALADFLTEVALDSSSCGVILDDPVTSLDLEWRQVIASILTREAARQQVIVFTHDLPFLYHLLTAAKKEQVVTRTHWIKRGDNDGVPGYVFLDNSPALEKDYKLSKHARDCYARAKAASPQEQERILRDGFGALRTSYEAFIIFELFNEVVLRFGERISFGRLEAIVWDDGIVRDVIASCERLSRYIEGHLHSHEFMPTPPTSKTLLKECEHFDALKRQLKELRKQKP